MTYDVPIASETTSQEIKTDTARLLQCVQGAATVPAQKNIELRITLPNILKDAGGANIGTYAIRVDDSYYTEFVYNANGYITLLNPLTIASTKQYIEVQLYLKDCGGTGNTFEDGSTYLPISRPQRVMLAQYYASGSIMVNIDIDIDMVASMNTGGNVKHKTRFATCDLMTLQWLVKMHNNGVIDIWDYWHVGDYRELGVLSSGVVMYTIIMQIVDYKVPTGMVYKTGGKSPITIAIYGKGNALTGPYYSQEEMSTNPAYSSSSLKSILDSLGSSYVIDSNYSTPHNQYRLSNMLDQTRAYVTRNYTGKRLLTRGYVYLMPPTIDYLTGLNSDGDLVNKPFAQMLPNGVSSGERWTADCIDGTHSHVWIPGSGYIDPADDEIIRSASMTQTNKIVAVGILR